MKKIIKKLYVLMMIALISMLSFAQVVNADTWIIRNSENFGKVIPIDAPYCFDVYYYYMNSNWKPWDDYIANPSAYNKPNISNGTTTNDNTEPYGISINESTNGLIRTNTGNAATDDFGSNPGNSNTNDDSNSSNTINNNGAGSGNALTDPNLGGTPDNRAPQDTPTDTEGKLDIPAYPLVLTSSWQVGHGDEYSWATYLSVSEMKRMAFRTRTILNTLTKLKLDYSDVEDVKSLQNYYDEITKIEKSMQALESSSSFPCYFFKDDSDLAKAKSKALTNPGRYDEEAFKYTKNLLIDQKNLLLKRYESINTFGCDILFGAEDMLESEVYQTIQYILMIIKIVIPIIIVVLGLVDLTKAVVANKEDDMKKAQDALIKRIIIGVVIFMLPTLVDIVVKLLANGADVCAIK